MSTYCRRTIDLTVDSSRADLPAVVDSADAALTVIAASMQRPPRPQVIVLVLDTDLGGNAVVVVDGTDSPDAVIDVFDDSPRVPSRPIIRPRLSSPRSARATTLSQATPTAVGALRNFRGARLRRRVVCPQRRRRLVPARPPRRTPALAVNETASEGCSSGTSSQPDVAPC